MEDPLTSIRNLVSALCLISETMEEPFGLVVQELARNIGDSARQLDKEHSYFFHLHHPCPSLEDGPPPDKDELGRCGMSSRKTTQKSEHNSSTFILPLDLLQQDCDIIDDQDEHIVLTLRLLKELIRDNHRLLMALAERSLGRDSDIPTATRAGAGAELRTLPVAALQLDSVILDDQDDHLVLTIRLPKEAIRKNLNMLMALSDACVA
jgi:hypothetical protein